MKRRLRTLAHWLSSANPSCWETQIFVQTGGCPCPIFSGYGVDRGSHLLPTMGELTPWLESILLYIIFESSKYHPGIQHATIPNIVRDNSNGSIFRITGETRARLTRRWSVHLRYLRCTARALMIEVICFRPATQPFAKQLAIEPLIGIAWE